jgi:hypothetical protein
MKMTTHRNPHRRNKKSELPVPDIALFFQGLMVVATYEGRKHCRVGILREVPDHDLVVKLVKLDFNTGSTTLIKEYDQTSIPEKLSLEVNDVSENKVRLFPSVPTEFDRKKPPASGSTFPFDFRWALDFEGKEVYDERVELDPDGFRSIFSFRGGLYFAVKVSGGQLGKIKKKKLKSLGHVALVLGGFIYLDKPTSEAVFSPLGYSIKRQDGIVHVVVLSQARPHDGIATSADSNDSVFYHQVIVGGVSGDRIRFLETVGSGRKRKSGKDPKLHKAFTPFQRLLDLVPFGDPSSTCLTAHISQTDLPS